MIDAADGNLTAQSVVVLAVGDWDHVQFGAALAACKQYAVVQQAATIAQAIHLLRGAAFAPNLLAVAQSWPGQFAASDIDRLRTLAPLARVWEFAGALCEGAMRSGRPWPAVLRCYASEGEIRLAYQFARLADALPVAWEFPVTATEEDRLIATAGEPIKPATGLIAIVAEDRAWGESLADAARQRGYACLTVRPHALPTIDATLPFTTWISGAAAVLWDTTDKQVHDLTTLQALQAAFGNAPILATVGFARFESIRAALAGGVRHVFAKPLDIDELFFLVKQVSALWQGSTEE